MIEWRDFMLNNIFDNIRDVICKVSEVVFDNIGDVICKVSKVLFWIFIASGIALFIVYWYSIGIFEEFFLPLLAGTGYILLTECLIVFPFYGFGKLVQNSEEIKHKLDK